MQTLRPYAPADRPGLSDVLVAAFHDDPGYAYSFPDRREACLREVLPRLHDLRWASGASVHVVERQGRIVAVRATTSSRLRPGLGAYLRFGLWRMPFTLGMRTVRRMLAADAEVGQLRNLVEPTEDHPHLAVLAVHPDAQGHGIGSMLVRTWLESTPLERPASLITTKSDNVIFYEKFGFRIAGQVGVGGGFTAWVMIRPAR